MKAGGKSATPDNKGTQTHVELMTAKPETPTPKFRVPYASTFPDSLGTSRSAIPSPVSIHLYAVNLISALYSQSYKISVIRNQIRNMQAES
ncbi:unnamed protein product [Linum trigynum]|uniref:Uncharacterized protein n=1 Tax=Linum trigynum TaxID=586398 RepID=A0AAV2DJT0_9ROSI